MDKMFPSEIESPSPMGKPFLIQTSPNMNLLSLHLRNLTFLMSYLLWPLEVTKL